MMKPDNPVDKNKLRIGIVGLGSIAKLAHIPILVGFPDVEILAAAEKDEITGEVVAKKWKIPKIYSSYIEMYEDGHLDAVFICLPNFLHVPAVREALKNGIHVFCEKPMGLSSLDARDLVIMAKNNDCVLAVGYNQRMIKNYKDAKEIVASTRLGSILQIHGVHLNAGPYASWIPSSDWFFNDKFGVLYDTGPHLIDLIRFILSDNIVEISASGICTMESFKIYDNISGNFITENNSLGTFSIGWKEAVYSNSFEVHGTGGSVIVNPEEIQTRYWAYGDYERVIYHSDSIKKIFRSQLNQARGRTSTEDAYRDEDRAFIDAIRGHSTSIVSGEDGLRVLEVLDAIKTSIEQKKTVRITNHNI
jgi:UDP-N-acetylglucosamine 3-dehydrogenase